MGKFCSFLLQTGQRHGSGEGNSWKICCTLLQPSKPWPIVTERARAPFISYSSSAWLSRRPRPVRLSWLIDSASLSLSLSHSLCSSLLPCVLLLVMHILVIFPLPLPLFPHPLCPFCHAVSLSLISLPSGKALWVGAWPRLDQVRSGAKPDEARETESSISTGRFG